MNKWNAYLTRKRKEYGKRFDTEDLDRRFLPYFESGQRIKVRFPWGEDITGTVGVTTGWKPCFLLIRTARSLGSAITLGRLETVVAVQRGHKYNQVERGEWPCQ